MPDANDLERLFTRSDGSFVFARWGRAIAPVAFGVEEATLPAIKGAVEAVGHLTGHPVAETDPELGSNLMFFFVRDWDELGEVPGLDRLIPDLASLVGRLKDADANQYRVFRFDAAPDGGPGAIKAAFVLLRMDEHLSQAPAGALALGQAVQVALLWSDTAFAEAPPLVAGPGGAMLRPDVANVLRAAYDPVLPQSGRDPSLALRLAARMGRPQ
ncbi:hypothetical protein BCF33_1266 [Hasllibacter halocynthiae]|uniref:Uncharacterized protein n=1 Tax=Hasllibacter halocynthiae TaxID=595589 RepID=A0A2T0X9U7_9RHOB|nr:hypothetical protein [Hasllibacter halocynthiae]PRY95644.1 hypothetical protein BCF33_1266 [Hasllibacter halocynthiae]